MVSFYLGNTYKLRGGGSGGVSASGATLRGAVLGQAPLHPLVSPTDFAAVASVSLPMRPYRYIHT